MLAAEVCVLALNRQLQFPFLWLIPAAVVVLLIIAFLPLFVPIKHPAQNEQFWRAGIFYVNRDDPALFVRKRFRTGYTINFGHSWSWWVLSLILLLATTPIVLAVSMLINIRHLAR